MCYTTVTLKLIFEIPVPTVYRMHAKTLWLIFCFSQYITVYFTNPNLLPVICIHGLKNHIEASDLVLYCECLDPYWFSSWLGNFWPSGGQKHLKGGVTRAPSQRKVFRTFFFVHFGTHFVKLNVFSINKTHLNKSGISDHFNKGPMSYNMLMEVTRWQRAY